MKSTTDMEKVLTVAKGYFDEENKGSKWDQLSKLPAAKLIYSADSRHRFRLLRDTMDFLSVDDLSLTLRAIWPDAIELEPSASGECTKDEAVSWFSACNPQKLMTPIDLMLLPMLPDVITVYRGENGLADENPADVVSWTLDPVTAMKNPEDSRFGAFYNGSGYQASVKKEDVLAFFFRHDMEIVLNPDKLFDIEHIDAMGELLTDDEACDMVFKMEHWYSLYYNAEIYRRLMEKLEPLGRVNELIEATMDIKKFDDLVFDFDLRSALIF